MLVLSRKENERIVIGENIIVTVVDIRGGKVGLGIEASREIPINREEVHDANRREGLCAAGAKQGRNGSGQGESANHRPRNRTPRRNGRKPRHKKSHAKKKEVK